MSDQLPPDVRDLLSAIRANLDTPDTGDDHRDAEQLRRRTVAVNVVLDGLADETRRVDLAADARFLRGQVAQHEGGGR